MSDTLVIIMFALVVLLGFVLAICLLLAPIFIAKRRKLDKKKINIIILLCVVSLVLGPTWLAALVLALVWDPADKKEPHFVEQEPESSLTNEQLPK